MSNLCQIYVKFMSNFFDIDLTIQPRLTFYQCLNCPLAVACRDRLILEIKHQAGLRLKRQRTFDQCPRDKFTHFARKLHCRRF